MATVGIIANPAAGKDIRRLVAQGRFIPNQEKVNILKRIFAGLQAAGVSRVLMMPDSALLGRAAMEDEQLRFDVDFVDMTVFNEERDSTRAAKAMHDEGVDCLITLGGDGTNRAVAKNSGQIPIVPVSTGTNNVFPVMVEGTTAGLAAGVVATRAVELDEVTAVSKRLEIYVDGEFQDIALVDLAVSRERFVGSRAIWDISTVHELFLTRAEPASIGLSAIGAQLKPLSMIDEEGMYIQPGEGDTQVTAPVAPGMVVPISILSWSVVKTDVPTSIDLRPCTIALDGERTFSVFPNQEAEVRLSRNGPRVVLIEKALRSAAINHVFYERTGSNGI